MEDFRNHSVEYHKTRLNAMFKYRGIVLTQEELEYFAELYIASEGIKKFDMSIPHMDIFVFLYKRDIENGIIS